MSKSLYKKVSIAALIMMASVFLSRVIGLLREMVIAYIGGTQLEVDAYQIAFVIPEILNHIVASGFLSITFIPIFSNYLACEKEDEGWMAFSVILNTFGILLLILIFFAVIFAPQLVSIVSPGIKNLALKSSAVKMTRIILPAQFFFFAGGLFMAVQFSKEKFAIPALAPLLYNIGIIITGILFKSILHLGMEGFSYGVIIGSFTGNFAIQLYGAKKVGMKYYPVFNLMNKDLIKYIKLTLPLMLGMTMTFSTEFFLRFFGSFLPNGSIACLNYSLRVVLIFVGLFGQAIGAASYPFMARLAAENKIFEMNRLLNNTLKYLSLIILFSALVIVLRHEIIMILFQRGKFDAKAVEITAHIMPFLMTGAFAFASQTIVVRGYYATQNTLFPSIFGTIAVVCSIPIYFFGMKYLGVNGVALGISLSAIIQVVLLYILWNRQNYNKESIIFYKFILKITLISFFVGAGLEFLRKYLLLNFISDSSFYGSFIRSIVISLVFLASILFISFVFKINELLEILKKIGKTFHKSRS